MRIAPSCVALVLAMALAPPVSAQTAEAEALFREGKRLMKKGRIAEACDKFEASERLDAQIGTELNLGDCRERNGQTASAWATFVKAAAAAKHVNNEKRATEARRRAGVLEKQLVYLTIQVPTENAVDELMIERNGTQIDRGMWDQAVPVDPDAYTITAGAPGRTSWSETIVVKTKSRVIEVPKLERKAADQPPTDDGSAAAGARADRVDTIAPSKASKPALPEHARRPRKYRSTAIALAAVGAGAVVTGVGFALYSKDMENQSDAVCPTTACTDLHAVQLNQTARLDGWIANIAWGVGGAALGGAIAAWWLGSPARDDAVGVVPIVSRGQAGLALGGRF